MVQSQLARENAPARTTASGPSLTLRLASALVR